MKQIYRLFNLRERGIRYSDTHLHRLEDQGRFPKRFKMNPEGGGQYGAVGWDADEIEQYLDSLIAARDAELVG